MLTSLSINRAGL